MSYSDFLDILRSIQKTHNLHFDLDHDNNGQIILYTNLREDEDGNLVPIEKEE